MDSGHIGVSKDGRWEYEHILIAERALGKPLPPGAQVHHADCNPANNTNSNLVICPTDAYHKLLHRRIRAMAACGNPNYRPCHFCHSYDDLSNLIERRNGTSTFHRECERVYGRARWPKRKASRGTAA